MQAILLAAGFGTRLWPLTIDRAKPAVPFLGRPLIASLVQRLKDCGFDRIVVNTHHQAASIRAALATHPEVRFSHEPDILGTAGGPALARDAGHLDPNDDTLIVNGKLYTEIAFDRVIETHRASGAAVTMALRDNPTRAHFREVLIDGDRVTGFGEGRIPAGPSPLLFTGIHAVAPQVLARMKPEFSDTIRDVYPGFIAAGEVYAHRSDEGRWWEFSTPERYWALHVQAHQEGLGLGHGDAVYADPSAAISPAANVVQAVVWAGARIDAGATVRRAVIAEGVHIAADERVEDCIVVRSQGVTTIERGQRWGDRVRVPLDASHVGTLRS